ncbi:MAG TPA: A/G-specific adenine glycosylase [Chloroflexota bacterium]
MSDRPLPAGVDPAAVAALSERLLTWYAEHRRDLPWRRTRDPYALVTVELMSQQTGVERIAPRWLRFVGRFPSWQAVASASVGDVIREWQGLGYNRRAVSLHRMATAVVERFGGELPTDRRALLELPGVGPYTADAILSFVHGQDVPAIDVNLRRVIGRVAFGHERASDSDLLAVARAALPRGQSADWNQALMDFASLQCTLRRPAHLVCPLLDVCRFAGSEPTVYPAAEGRPARLAAERKAPFVGSTRYLRGRIVEALRRLRGGQTMTLDELRATVAADGVAAAADPGELVAGLVRDGLVHEHEVDGQARFSLP